MVTPFKLAPFAPEDTVETVFFPAPRLANMIRTEREAGFAEGYDLARQELEAQNSETAARIARHLQDASFTHYEARKTILNSLHPLIEAMVEKVLPEIASAALSDIVAAQITSVASLATDAPIRLNCAPDTVSLLQSTVQTLSTTANKFQITPDRDLSRFEVTISSASSEKHLDLDHAVQGICDAVQAFYEFVNEEEGYG